MVGSFVSVRQWAFPTREELRERLITLVHDILARDRTPVLLAYSLGKAQEATAMLHQAGELLRFAETSGARTIYLTHGAARFAADPRRHSRRVPAPKPADTVVLRGRTDSSRQS